MRIDAPGSFENHGTLMKRFSCLIILLTLALPCVLADEIEDVSPNGKYGLDVARKDGALESVAFVALPSKRVIRSLVDTDAAPESFEMLWSDDSRNFAFYRQLSKSGTTEAWSLDDNGEWNRLLTPEIELPFEADAVPASVTSITNFIKPLKWTGYNQLAVERTGTSRIASGDVIAFEYNATLTADPDGAMSVSNLAKISETTVAE